MKKKFMSMVLSIILILSSMTTSIMADSNANDTTSLNEITEIICNDNDIIGIKIANSYENATNIQAFLAVYEDDKLLSLTSKYVDNNQSTVTFDTPITPVANQTVKAFLWNYKTIEPLTRSVILYTMSFANTQNGYVETPSGSYISGNNVSIKAIPADTYIFDRWVSSGGGSFEDETSAQTSFTMPGSNVVITALFKRDPNIVVINKADISNINSQELGYFASPTATRETTLSLDSLTSDDVYINNENAEIADILSVRDYAEIWVINNDSDSAYEQIVVKDYDYGVVAKIEEPSDNYYRIEVVGSLRFMYLLDFNDESVTHKITDKNGKPVEVTSLKKGDIIAVIHDNPSELEIVNLGNNTISGVVTEKNSSDNTIAIDGNSYYLTERAPDILPGHKGSFYLTKNGYVFYFIAEAEISQNYAYILDLQKTSDGDESVWSFDVLQKDGTRTTLYSRDIFEVGDTQVESSTSTWEDLSFLSALQNKGIQEEIKNRIVYYKLNAENKIKGLYKADSATIRMIPGDELISLLEEDAFVFDISSDGAEAARITDISYLSDGCTYFGAVAYNSYGENEAVIITSVGDLPIVSALPDVAVADQINPASYNDYPAYALYYYTSNDEVLKSVLITNDTNFYGGDIMDLVKGAAFMLAEDPAGIATDICVIAKPNAGVYEFTSKDGTTGASLVTAESGGDTEFVAGYILTWNNAHGLRTIDVVTNTGGQDFISIINSSNTYTFVNSRAANNRGYIAVADWMADSDFDRADESMANYFFARIDNGIARDFIVLGDRTTIQ